MGAKPPAVGSKGVWGQSPQRLAILGDLIPRIIYFRHVSAEILPKNLRNLFIIVRLYSLI